jgi:hypothetical protein
MPRKKQEAQVAAKVAAKVASKKIKAADTIPIISIEEALSAQAARTAPSAGPAIPKIKKEKDDGAPPRLLDGDFGTRIELIHGPQVEHHSQYYPHGHLSIGIVGASGCGKSYLLLSILPQIAKLSQVIICTRVHTPVYDQIRKWCDASTIEDDDDPESKIEFALFTSPIEADAGIARMTEEKPEDTYGIIIFDDFNEGTTAHNSPYMKVQNVCTMQKRNDGYHSCIVTQQYTNIGTKSRNNTNMLFAFTMHDKYALDGFSRHVFEATGIDSQDVRECFRDVTKVPHSYMLLVQEGGSGHLYAKRGADSALEEVEIVSSRMTLESVFDDKKLLSLLENEKQLVDRPRSTMVYRELLRVRKNIQDYIEYLARENALDESELKHELFNRGLISS